MTYSKTAPQFFPHDNNNPTYGMDGLLRGLVSDKDAIGAESYIVKRNGSTCIGVKQCTFVYDGNGPIPVIDPNGR